MFFAPTSPEKILAQQIYEAKRRHLEHAAAAEYHQAIADAAAKSLIRLNQLKEQQQ